MSMSISSKYEKNSRQFLLEMDFYTQTNKNRTKLTANVVTWIFLATQLSGTK